MKNWQSMIGKWVVKTFGHESMTSHERSMRFLEEAMELVQAHGITRDEVAHLSGRVYSKPVGKPRQEVGGVFVTFLAFCDHHQYDSFDCLKTEWSRINSPEAQAKLLASQASKLEAGL